MNKEYKHKYVRCSKCFFYLTPKKLSKRVTANKIKNCCFLTMLSTYGFTVAKDRCILQYKDRCILQYYGITSIFKSIYGNTVTIPSAFPPSNTAFFIPKTK